MDIISPDTIITAVGSSNNASIAIHAYPNPVANEMTVELRDQVQGDYSLSLTDAQGTMVDISKTEIFKNRILLHLGNQNSGLYFLNVRQGANQQVIKIIKR